MTISGGTKTLEEGKEVVPLVVEIHGVGYGGII